ncbi:MAG: hypothetical protein MJE63_11310 [Proteobacteria bacterium]|nr:hypothetical protein [Pseudomonadota bacterium]
MEPEVVEQGQSVNDATINREQEESTSNERVVPKDFAQRLAAKIASINERELDEEVASSQVASIIYRNMNSAEMFPYFIETIEALLRNEDNQRFAATTWTAVLWHEDEHPEYRQFLEKILDFVISGHSKADRPPYESDDIEGEFSAYAYYLGESFIQMMKLNSDLYNVLTDIYSYVIRTEMHRDLKRKKDEADKKRVITGRKRDRDGDIVNPKKLYDDIVDYISQRGTFRSDTLNQKNPNEYIIILADRMRSTRRYVIQDIMNRFALEKKKQLEKELREREASAEEVITAVTPFKHGLYLFWLEKRYNFKYLAVEKVRITLQIFAIFLGLGAVGVGFLELAPVSLIEGLLIGAMMTGYAKMFCSRYVFNAFYPKDVTVELEKDVGAFTPVFRKMSLQQMNSFMLKQIKEPDNALLLHLLPEYVRYIFAVMPDRTEILMTKENINELMERVEVNLSKFQRGR